MDILLTPNQGEKARVLIFNGGEQEYSASTPVRKITVGPYEGCNLVHQSKPYLPLPPDSMLKSGEVYYLMGPEPKPQRHPIHQRMDGSECYFRGQSVKIVLTKQQLELLLRNGAKQCQSNGIVLRFMEDLWEREGCSRWRPSLHTIPENC